MSDQDRIGRPAGGAFRYQRTRTLSLTMLKGCCMGSEQVTASVREEGRVSCLLGATPAHGTISSSEATTPQPQ